MSIRTAKQILDEPEVSAIREHVRAVIREITYWGDRLEAHPAYAAKQINALSLELPPMLATVAKGEL